MIVGSQVLGDTDRNEAYIPAEPPPPRPHARLPQADEHQEWPSHPEASARQGPQAADSLLIHALTRRERLRRRPEFLTAQRKGVRKRGRYLTLFVLPNHRDESRLGVIATRRMGGAVRRNRCKRLARELFRLDKRNGGFDIVVLPHRGFSDAPFLALQADYRSALRRGQRSHG